MIRCVYHRGIDKQKSTMPPNKALPPLTDICSEWVLEWVFRSLNVYGTRKERFQQRKYLTSSLYSKLRQHLLLIAFQQPLFQRNLTCKSMMLELLGDESTQIVDFSAAGLAYIDEVSHLYRNLALYHITNLTQLGITCNLRSQADRKFLLDANSTFYPVFKQMKNLRFVKLTGLADKTLLTILGRNCPHLEYLNIAESLRIDDDGVARFLFKDPEGVVLKNIKDINPQDLPTNPCASTLKVFCITATNITSVGVIIILHCVPNFMSFEGDVDVGSLTKTIGSLQPVDGHRTFKLKKLWDTKLLLTHTELINRVCPHLTFLSTDASSLNALHVLQSVSSLTLKLYFKNVVTDLYNYLYICGRTLRELVLVDHINSFLDIAWLVELTPNLERLEATLVKEEENNMVVWPFLTTAKVTLESSKTLLALMTHTPNLKDLDVTVESWSEEENYESIDDALISEAVADDRLQQLQRLRISKCAIGMKGLNSLLLHCPDLCYVAPLAFWEGLSQDDLSILHQKSRDNNWAFRYTLRTDWENGQRPVGGLRRCDGS